MPKTGRGSRTRQTCSRRTLAQVIESWIAHMWLTLSTVKVGRAGMTKGKFGFHRGGGKHEPSPAAGYVQIYVKSSALSRTPDLAISAHLMTEAEIDDF